MSAETTTAPAPTLPPRAAVALLTLKVRAARQEADHAEAQAAAAESEAGRAALRARPEPPVETRTRELEEALAQARLDAASAIAAAHQEAGRIVAAATPIPVIASVEAPAAPLSPAAAPTPSQGFDAELFARTFATAFAGLLDERLPRGGAALGAAPAPAAKKSFWAHALHVDVVLLGVATLIVVGVLLAWMA